MASSAMNGTNVLSFTVIIAMSLGRQRYADPEVVDKKTREKYRLANGLPPEYVDIPTNQFGRNEEVTVDDMDDECSYDSAGSTL
ncbi:hypothetical protein GCM10028805_33450 [Spirosoma harenae]